MPRPGLAEATHSRSNGKIGKILRLLIPAGPRSFQVIELSGDDADLLTNITSVSSGTAPDSYANVPWFSSTVTVGSTNSVVLMLSNINLADGDDGTRTSVRRRGSSRRPGNYRWVVGCH